LNREGKQRWNILKNHHYLSQKELMDWGHCWKVQENVDENSLFPQKFCARGTNTAGLLHAPD
jgi:hypothetical protein